MSRRVLILSAALVPVAQAFAQLPPGFEPIFDGRSLSGWHISETNHHGNTRSWRAQDGILLGSQDPPKVGGILLTDRADFRNFEVYVEIQPDYGCDGGLFLRSTERGEAYQVMIDFLEGGNVGGIYGERLPEMNRPEAGAGQRLDPGYRRFWKDGQWNSLRARIEGDAPHIQVWLNGMQVANWRAARNYLPEGLTTGHIALQIHRANDSFDRWKPGGVHRFRNLGVKVLP